MKIGEEVYIHGYIDEIRKDTVIIRNNGGYFGTVPAEITEAGWDKATTEVAISQAHEEGYKIGAKDAWNFVAKIEAMTCGKVAEIFGIEEDSSAWLCNQMSYEEALNRYSEWKECQNISEIPSEDMTLEQARYEVKKLRGLFGRKWGL